MIQQTDLSKCFDKYTGGNDVNEALKFIQEQFQAKVKDNRTLHVYFIAARFKKDVKYTWDEVKSIFYTVSLPIYLIFLKRFYWKITKSKFNMQQNISKEKHKMV